MHVNTCQQVKHVVVSNTHHLPCADRVCECMWLSACICLDNVQPTHLFSHPLPWTVSMNLHEFCSLNIGNSKLLRENGTSLHGLPFTLLSKAFFYILQILRLVWGFSFLGMLICSLSRYLGKSFRGQEA